MRTALLFPGQGAPAAEWRQAVATTRPELLTQTYSLLDDDPFARFGQGTEYDQPAIYCASLAAFSLAGQPMADLHAGHSLGEIAALACAGTCSTFDGLRLVVERGSAMAAAARARGAGAMLAVGAPVERLDPMLEADDGIAVANFNSPSQTVLTGSQTRIAAAAAELKADGLRTKLLPVAGAFHSPAMRPAAAAFERALAEVEFNEPAVPVLSGRTGRPFSDPRRELASSLLEPVRWIDVVATLEREGVRRCQEIGPGRALGGLVRRTAEGEIEVLTSPLPEVAGA